MPWRSWHWGVRRDVVLWVVAALLGRARSQVKVLAPESLAAEFSQTHGIVYGTTATFGAPYYGERVMGQLLYGESKGGSHCTDADYVLPPPKAPAQAGEQAAGRDLVNVVLVRRGGCTFVTKVLAAQRKHAHAVVVVDKENSKLSSDDVQKIVMADDGFGSKVRIPSVLVGREEGQKLIDAARKGTVLVELAWDIPRGEVVVADFWMSSGSRESSEFLRRFKDPAEALGYHLQFTPHYHVFSLPEGQSYNRLCLEHVDGCELCQPSPDRFCGPDPDGPGPVTGADVVNEDLRQVCIWNVTSRRQSNGATFSQDFWNYVYKYSQDCPVDGSGDVPAFGYQCSKSVMQALGIQVAAVEECVRENFAPFLEEQRTQVAWSPQALRLNGWRYSGPLDPETVLKAVCSGYASPLQECNALLEGYEVVQWTSPGTTLSGLLATVLVLALIFAVVLFLYRRHVTSSVRRVLREEVMLEVQMQMADYMPMEDGPGSKRGTLSF